MAVFPDAAPNRALAAAMKQLRHDDPRSYRQLGRDAGMTHAAAHQIIHYGFSSYASWAAFARLVRALHGEPERYRELWEATRPVVRTRDQGRVPSR